LSKQQEEELSMQVYLVCIVNVPVNNCKPARLALGATERCVNRQNST